jgi:hypothetical protein
MSIHEHQGLCVGTTLITVSQILALGRTVMADELVSLFNAS